MLKIGEFQELEIFKDLPQGLYLIDDEDDEEVLLPRSFVKDEMEIGDKINVFVYCDSEEREVATTEKPFITVGQYGYLKITDVTNIGAFCDFGTSKDLLIPFHNQHEPLEVDKRYVIYMYLDDLSDRLVGTTKLSRHLDHIADKNLKTGQAVDVLVFRETPIGYKVVINQNFSGLIYKNETPKKLNQGDQMTAYLKPIRPDGKIDVSLHPIGPKHVEANAQKILDAIKAAGGMLKLNDKSDPADIQAAFGISKKVFKKAIGGLYKQKKIIISDKGISLVK